jgi:hypothetical protein
VVVGVDLLGDVVVEVLGDRDDLIAAEPGDVLRAVAQVSQDLLGVLAQGRRWCRRGVGLPETTAGGSRYTKDSPVSDGASVNRLRDSICGSPRTSAAPSWTGPMGSRRVIARSSLYCRSRLPMISCSPLAQVVAGLPRLEIRALNEVAERFPELLLGAEHDELAVGR